MLIFVRKVENCMLLTHGYADFHKIWKTLLIYGETNRKKKKDKKTNEQKKKKT